MKTTPMKLSKLLSLSLFTFMVLFFPPTAPALDLNLRPGGFAFIPLGSGADLFETGGGGRLGFDADISSVLGNPWGLGYTAGIEAGYVFTPLGQGASGALHLYSGGLNLGLFYFPLSRLFLRAEVAAGLYQGVSPNVTDSSLWIRAGGETGFRFTPSLILSANMGYGAHHNSGGGNLNAGFFAGLAVQLSFHTRGSGGGLDVHLVQDEGVYPLLLSLYQKNGAANLVITNRENAEIRNVEVFFRAGNYTAAELSCGSIPLLARGRQAEFPLLADFSPALLDFTGDGRIIGEVVIRYTFLGSPREAVQGASLQVFNRNRFPRTDMNVLASFVSPTAPQILEYSRYITGMARTRRRAGHNVNMQNSIWLFESLAASGISGVSGAALSGVVQGTLPGTSPDANDSANSASGEAQYPVQTLAYRSGSPMDLGLVYGACLEASGIPAAFIPLENDFITAVFLDMQEDEAEGFFTSMDKLVIIDDQVWLPLSMASLERGFMESWAEASRLLDGVFGAGRELEFVRLEDAWAAYPPAPFPLMEAELPRPSEQLAVKAADAALNLYIAAEIEALVGETDRRIRASQDTAALYNRLGNLQLRAGRQTEAKAAYERAAAMGSSAAAANRGNIAFQENDVAGARRWFTEALRRDGSNRIAARGLELLDNQGQ
jgi:hypothetical protein